MYHSILVPLDGSPRAERIMPYVEALAEKFGSQLLLVQVIEPLVMSTSPYDSGAFYVAEEIERQTKAAKDYLAGLQERLRQQGLMVQVQVEYGSVVATLLALADQHKVDLVAMASHGRSGLARVFYGSAAAGILQKAERPLLVIRAQDDE